MTSLLDKDVMSMHCTLIMQIDIMRICIRDLKKSTNHNAINVL